MPRKRHKAEEIVAKLRQVEVLSVSAGDNRIVTTGSRPVAGRPGRLGITFSVDRFVIFW